MFEKVHTYPTCTHTTGVLICDCMLRVRARMCDCDLGGATC